MVPRGFADLVQWVPCVGHSMGAWGRTARSHWARGGQGFFQTSWAPLVGGGSPICQGLDLYWRQHP